MRSSFIPLLFFAILSERAGYSEAVSATSAIFDIFDEQFGRR
jgi:hypothetical protein